MQMTKAKKLFRECRKLITKIYTVNNGFVHNNILFPFHNLKLETDCHYQRGLRALLVLLDLWQLHSYRLTKAENYSFSHYQ